MILMFGMAVEQPAENEPRHRHRGLVGPPEAPPHLVARLLLRRVVRHAGGARRMQPDRQVVAGERREYRRKARLIERVPGDVGENLNAARAQRLDRALGFRERPVHVVERDGRDKGREAVGMARAEFRHGIVGDARERLCGRALRDVLDRRVGQRDHLPVVARGIHLAEAGVEIEQLGHAAQPRADVLEPGRDPAHLRKEAVGQDVGIDVDRHGCCSRDEEKAGTTG